MRPTSQARLRPAYLLCVKATGIVGLGFVPVLAFAVAAGLVAAPELLVPALVLTGMAAGSSLVLVSDTGLAQRVLRPQGRAQGLLAFGALVVLGGSVLGQVALGLLAVDLPRGLELVGLSPLSAPVLVQALVAAVALVAGLAAMLALVVRLDPPPAPIPAADPAEAVTPTRVRRAEQDAAPRPRPRRSEAQPAAQLSG